MPAPLHGYIEEVDRLRAVAPQEDHVLQTAEELREIFEIAQATLIKRNPRIGISSEDIPQQYNIGDLVMYKTVEPSKLDPAWDGPLEVIACHPPRYEVRRLGEEGIGVDPWIEHAHNIKPYYSLLSYNAQRQAPEHDPDEDTFVVSRILKDRKRRDGEVEFLTTYLGYEEDPEHHRWLTADQFDGPELLDAYWATKARRSRTRRRTQAARSFKPMTGVRGRPQTPAVRQSSAKGSRRSTRARRKT